MRDFVGRSSRRIPLVFVFASSFAFAQPVVEVSIEKYEFIPREVKIKADWTVRWTNNEKRTSHSIVFPDEGPLESDRLLPGDTWQRTFDKAGTYPYTCGPHPEMKAIVVVE